MKTKLQSNKKAERLDFLLQLAHNIFFNTDPAVYAKIRDCINNIGYDFETKKGTYFLSSVEELKKDLLIYSSRNSNQELNLRIQHYLGILMLIGLSIYTFGELVNYFSENESPFIGYKISSKHKMN